VKNKIKSIFRKLGYNIQRIPKGKTERGFNAQYLKLFCTPKTVIDIGVGYGTDGLYEAYQDAEFHLVEPVVEFKAPLETKYGNINKMFHNCAIGKFDGAANINVDFSNLQHSSFMDRAHEGSRHQENREVPIFKLDSIISDDVAQPVLLKIDTEGNLLNVILGADKILKKCQYVLVELSVSERFKGSYSFSDFISAMSERTFELFDILSQHYLPVIGTKYIDAVFVNKSFIKGEGGKL